MINSPEKTVLIIGAGIAGLSAGCYGQMNGYQTQIFEMHTLPGGVCTSWRRKGYTFDGAIHWLTGTQPGSAMHDVLSELGALKDKRVITHEIFRQIVIGDQHLNVFTDADKLEQEMLRVSPKDRDVIKDLVREVRRFANFKLPLDRSHPSIVETIQMLPYLPGVLKYQRMTIAQYAARFKDPFLRQAFLNIFPMPKSTVLVAILTLALFSRGDNGYPEGGSLQLSKAIERRYQTLGGQVHYQSKVTRILVEEDRAVGVQLSDGSRYRGDYVISAADGHSTLFDMLGEGYVDPETCQHYQDLPLFKPLVYVCLGINRDLSSEPHIITNVLEPPVEFAGENHERLGWFHYCYDPSSAPTGKSAVISMIETNYEFWKEAYADPSRYELEKQKVAQRVIEKMEERYPGIRSQVEVIDVATPMTWVRYTGNWQGAYEGWLPTQKALGSHFKKFLPGLKSFFMCGQWVEPGGGVPVSMISGRNVIGLICRADRRRFLAHVER